MPTSKTRRNFRPGLDRLEGLCLLSGGVRAAAATLPPGVVDLKPTSIARDLNRAILDSTASFRREGVLVTTLTADDATDTIRGGAVVSYKIPVLGSVTSTIRFRTSVENPRPRDVKVSVSKFGAFVRRGDRDKVALAIVKILRKDHDQIVAAMA